MDDLSEMLAGILNNPESLEQVRQMAENLMGGNEEKPEKGSDPDISSLLGDGGLDIAQMGTVMNILSQLKSRGNDSRAQLLLALKPHLSPPKREKVDTAVKLLKIIDILPLLKDSGILNL